MKCQVKQTFITNYETLQLILDYIVNHMHSCSF